MSGPIYRKCSLCDTNIYANEQEIYTTHQTLKVKNFHQECFKVKLESDEIGKYSSRFFTEMNKGIVTTGLKFREKFNILPSTISNSSAKSSKEEEENSVAVTSAKESKSTENTHNDPACCAGCDQPFDNETKILSTGHNLLFHENCLALNLFQQGKVSDSLEELDIVDIQSGTPISVSSLANEYLPNKESQILDEFSEKKDSRNENAEPVVSSQPSSTSIPTEIKVETLIKSLVGFLTIDDLKVFIDRNMSTDIAKNCYDVTKIQNIDDQTSLSFDAFMYVYTIEGGSDLDMFLKKLNEFFDITNLSFDNFITDYLTGKI